MDIEIEKKIEQLDGSVTMQCAYAAVGGKEVSAHD